MVTQGNKNKKKQVKHKRKDKTSIQTNFKKESKCFFYKKNDVKKDCYKFKDWLGKKGTQLNFTCMI